MKLDYSTFGLVIRLLTENSNEIIDTFDKADKIGVGAKSSDVPDIFLKVNEYCKHLMPKKLWSFITWWRKYYFFPRRPGRTPSPQFHSSPRE